jgi:tetratricopeptide (TPR) repeat protein
MRGNWAEALRNDLKSSSILESLVAAAPSDERLQRNLEGQYNQLSFDLNKNGDRVTALVYCGKAEAISEALVAAHPDNVGARFDLGASYAHMGGLLFASEEFGKSLETWRKALVIHQAAAEADPNDSRAQMSLAAALNRVGWLLVKTDSASDVQYIRKGLEIREKLYAAEPANPRRKDVLANSYATLGEAEVMLASRLRLSLANRIRHWREARSWYKRALEIWTPLNAAGLLRADDAGEPDRITREIAKCDAALTKAKLELGAIK